MSQQLTKAEQIRYKMANYRQITEEIIPEQPSIIDYIVRFLTNLF